MKKIFTIASVFIVIAVILNGVGIFATTKNIDDIKKEFVNQSENNSSEFVQSDFISNDDWDYVTYVSKNTGNTGFEMYLIRSTDFLCFNNLNRFKIVEHFVGDADSIIDYDYSEISIQNEQEKVFFVYSSNSSYISKIKCEFVGASGNIQFEELGVSYNMPFSISVILQENDMKLNAMECLDADENTLFSCGEFTTN